MPNPKVDANGVAGYSFASLVWWQPQRLQRAFQLDAHRHCEAHA